MKIVLSTTTRPPHGRGTFPPLHIALLGAVLEQAGYAVALLDPYHRKYTVAEAAQAIIAEKPDIVGITANTWTRFQALDLIRAIKKQSRPVIVGGGPHFTLTARDALDKVPELDIVVRGEGEMTLLELVQAIEAKRNLYEIPGISYRDAQGAIIENPNRPLIEDLNSLPLPAWHLLDVQHQYQKSLDKVTSPIPAIGVMSSRGCPSKCAFCAAPILNNRLRLRDPIKFVDELEFITQTYGYRGFWFWDDTFNLHRKHCETICQEIIRRKLDIKWEAPVRVGSMDEDLLKLMKQAGCVELGYGVESGSPKILKVIKKGITDVDRYRHIIKTSADLGFHVKTYFIVSHPEETVEDLRMTIRLMKEFRSYGPNVHVIYGVSLAYPVTELGLYAQQAGIFPENFSWNVYHEFPKSNIAGVDPFLPPYEGSLKIEQIKATIFRELNTPREKLQIAWRAIKKRTSWKDLTLLIRSVIKTMFRRRRVSDNP